MPRIDKTPYGWCACSCLWAANPARCHEGGWALYAFVDRAVETLPNGGRFLLWAMRGWTHANARGICPPIAIGRGFAGMRVLPALPDFHKAMLFFNRDCVEHMHFSVMSCAQIGEHEAVMIALWRDVATGNSKNLHETLTLLVDDSAILPLTGAMTAVSDRLKSARLDLARLSNEIVKEMKE